MGRTMQHAMRDAQRRDRPDLLSPFAHKGHWLQLRGDGTYEICWKNERSGKVSRRSTETMALEEAKRRLKMFVQGNRTFPAFLNLGPSPDDIPLENKQQEQTMGDVTIVGSPEWLRAQMRMKSMTAPELAERVGGGMHKQTIYSWRNAGVPAKRTQQVAEIFGVEITKGTQLYKQETKRAKPPAGGTVAPRKPRKPRKPPAPNAPMPTPEQAFLNFKRALVHHCQVNAGDDIDRAIAKLETVKAFQALWEEKCQLL